MITANIKKYNIIFNVTLFETPSCGKLMYLHITFLWKIHWYCSIKQFKYLQKNEKRRVNINQKITSFYWSELWDFIQKREYHKMSLNCDSMDAPPTVTSPGPNFFSYIETFLQKFCLLTFSHVPMTPWDRNNLLRRQFLVHWTVLYRSRLGRIWDCIFRVVFTPFSFPFFFCTGHPSTLAFRYSVNIPVFWIIYIFRCYILTYLFFIAFWKVFRCFCTLFYFFLTKVAVCFDF